MITSNRGLLPAEQPITLPELQHFGTVNIDPREPRYLDPLVGDARLIAEKTSSRTDVVLLGSISTAKYAEPLLQAFGPRLLFPSSFVGRGDMSRGGLLLRHAAEGRELDYEPVLGAVRRGRKPAKLPARSWGYSVLSGKTSLGNGPERMKQSKKNLR